MALLTVGSARRSVYYDPERVPVDGSPFRTGGAAAVALGADGELCTEAAVRISPNSLHALWGHGEIDAIARDGLAEPSPAPGVTSLVSPASVEAVLPILYAADRNTYGCRHEFVVAESSGASGVEYRVVVDNREYQRTLAQLQFLFGQAARHGHGVSLLL
ncbi:MAG: hypothetical protein MJE66_03615 [Proteobacteria bacterium]|nr:hypothetical protein [Pseudomonadota bacterium]